MSYSMGGQPSCFACHRPASRFDRQIGEWVCEGNADCGMSKGVTREQRAEYDRISGKAFVCERMSSASRRAR